MINRLQIGWDGTEKVVVAAGVTIELVGSIFSSSRILALFHMFHKSMYLRLKLRNSTLRNGEISQGFKDLTVYYSVPITNNFMVEKRILEIR